MTLAYFYGQGFLRILTETDIDWNDDTIKCALLTSAYTPDRHNHDFFSDVSSAEVVGTGYTAGGVTLANKVTDYTSGIRQVACRADDALWPGSTITARYAVIYKDTGTAATSPLISLVDFESNVASSGSTFTIDWGSGRQVLLVTLA